MNIKELDLVFHGNGKISVGKTEQNLVFNWELIFSGSLEEVEKFLAKLKAKTLDS